MKPDSNAMRHFVILALVGLMLAAVSGCEARRAVPKAKIGAPVTRENLAAGVKSWGYWLQNPNLRVLGSSPYDLVVIDYSADGTDAKAFSREQVSALQTQGKIVLCYFSIGEAETYRFYWKDSWKDAPPSFLGEENPDWPGNYKVRYWEESWLNEALIPYMDRILAAGFDGVYLDIIDAYWFWYEQGRGLQECADGMVRLVAEIGNYFRSRTGDSFLVCPQNALGIIAHASPAMQTLYFETIDMIGVESLFFNYHSEEDRSYRNRMLETFHQKGKPILSIEYIPPSLYAKYFSLLKKHPFPVIGYPSTPDRTLDSLTVCPPPPG